MTRRAAWVLGSILIGTSACAPTGDTTAPLAMTTNIAVDVGRGESLRIGERGEVTLDDVVLPPIGDDDRVHGHHITVTPDDVTLTLGLGDESRVWYYRVTKFDLKARRVRWDSIVKAGLGLDDEPTRWRAVEARNRLIIVEGRTVVAIDTRTGAQAWAFDHLMPVLDREYVDRITPQFVTFDVEHARMSGRRLVLSARLRDERALSMLEVDVDTGRRVYVESRRDAPVRRELGEFTRRVFEVAEPNDGQPPPELPPIPLRLEGWDGIAVGTTLLVWNVHTQRGLIVNPMHDELAEVLERAQALPVAWMGVVDTKQLADAVGASGMTFPLATKPSPAHFWCSPIASSSLDVVDAAALARTLEVPAIATLQALPDDLTILFEYPDDDATIRLVWGPFAFEDSSRPEEWQRHVMPL